VDEYEYSKQQDDNSPSTYITFSSRASGINATALAIMVASSLSLRAVPVAISFALLPSTNQDRKQSCIVVDPTMEEESKASARFGFGWAIGQGLRKSPKSKSSGMDVDGNGEEVDMELVWTESEGSFSRAEVRTILLTVTFGS
jgi:hypothetical protein